MLLRKTKITKIILVAMILISFIPFPTESIPELKIRVVDRSGISISDVEIVEEWTNSSVLGKSNVVRVTDRNGIVIFPSRIFICPLLLRGLLKIGEVLNFITGHGTPIGGHATIKAKKTKDFLYYRQGGETSYDLVTYRY